jgi:hypothetical protein
MRGCPLYVKPFLHAARDEPMQAVGFFGACLTIIAGHMLPGLLYVTSSDQHDGVEKKLKRIVIPLGATHNVLFACPQH